MAKLKATFHVKKDIGYDELEITTSADGVTYGGGTSGLSATDVQSAIDEVVTETTASLNTKQATITGGATTIATSNLTVNKALISDASGKVSTSATSNTELGYLSGVTSAVQTQINAKQGKVANVDDTEIGYLNGVTSNIQTQLNNKSTITTVVLAQNNVVSNGFFNNTLTSGLTLIGVVVSSSNNAFVNYGTHYDYVRVNYIAGTGVTTITNLTTETRNISVRLSFLS